MLHDLGRAVERTPRGAPHPLHEPAQHQHPHGCDRKRQQRHERIVVDHDRDEADDRQHIAAGRDHDELDDVARPVGRHGEPCHELARMAIGEEADGLVQQVVVDLLLQGRHDAVAGPRHEDQLAAGREAANDVEKRHRDGEVAQLYEGAGFGDREGRHAIDHGTQQRHRYNAGSRAERHQPEGERVGPDMRPGVFGQEPPDEGHGSAAFADGGRVGNPHKAPRMHRPGWDDGRCVP